MKDPTYTSPAKRGDVLVSLSHSVGGAGPAVRLRVEDQCSGEQIVEVTLSPEQYTAIMGSRVTPVPGASLSAHPDRIGRTQQVSSTDLPRGVTAEQIAQAVAEYSENGWDEVVTRATNTGLRVIANRWLDNAQTAGA